MDKMQPLGIRSLSASCTPAGSSDTQPNSTPPRHGETGNSCELSHSVPYPICASVRVEDGDYRLCCCCCQCECHAVANPSYCTFLLPVSVVGPRSRCNKCTVWETGGIAYGRLCPRFRGPCVCSRCCCCTNVCLDASELRSVIECARGLHYLPHIVPTDDTDEKATLIAASPRSSDFSWSTDISPCFYARLCYSGFLPICSKLEEPGWSRPVYILLPKLHRERACVSLQGSQYPIHLSKSLRRRAKNFRITINRAFDQVVAGCIRRHGEGWLWKPVRQVLRALHRETLIANSRGEGRDQLSGTEWQSFPHLDRQLDTMKVARDVEAHSIEIWVRGASKKALKILPPSRSCESDSEQMADETVYHDLGSSGEFASYQDPTSCDYLVAGELGIAVGKIYISLTGFTDVDGAGSLQLALTRLILQQKGERLIIVASLNE